MTDSSAARNNLEGHKVRAADVNVCEIENYSNTVEDIYDDSIDVLLIREAFPQTAIAAVTERLENKDADLAWLQPNRVLPGGDIHVLGVGAAPTGETPAGPSLDAYIAGSVNYSKLIANLFGATLDPGGHIKKLLEKISGGRAVDVPMTPDGDRWIPCTVRSLDEGQQIYPHHDYHYPLSIYTHLASRLDTSLLLSYFVTLKRPEDGGKLVVYGLKRTDPDQPTLPNGFLDAQALQSRFRRIEFDMNEGDMMVFGSGRMVHQVTPVVGSRARITMGGFLALDEGRNQVFFWS